MHEVHHWPERMQYDADTTRGGLFTPYVNAFLKLKQEASGWPGWCKTETDKGKYISDYYDREGIALDYVSVQKNAGLRSQCQILYYDTDSIIYVSNAQVDAPPPTGDYLGELTDELDAGE